MVYKAGNAIKAIKNYMNLTDDKIEIINDTKDRGMCVDVYDEKVVLFIYPLVHKKDDSKNYFDTRDSGPHERAVAWNYAIRNKLKYFCLGVNDEVGKYVNYIFSLECSEKNIQILSGTVDGDRGDGIKGNQIIIPNDYIPSKPFERIRNRQGTYISTIRKDRIYEYLMMFDNRPYLLDSSEVEVPEEESIESEPEISTDEFDSKVGENIILYGVPGAGKSYKIDNEYGSDPQYRERVVFHPDYTYSDFIGQLLPDEQDGQIKYSFSEGPFTKIMKEACNDPAHHYYLIIEELNRGNAPAIFGDIFQLLDRNPDGSGKYSIYNKEMSRRIYDDKKGDHPVAIPSNLSILATMNTSDQNVFTLDNAFQRRWKMRLIHNNFSKIENDDFHNNHIDHLIAGSNISWNNFATVINAHIASLGKDSLGAEDKRLGVFFVTDAELDNKEDFAEKVLKYLWDDAFKMDRPQAFLKKYDTFEEVIDAYLGAVEDPLKAVLSDEIYGKMLTLATKH